MVGGTTQGFDINTSVTDDVAVMRVIGDVDVRTGPRLISAVRDVFRADLRRIEIDGSGVGFLDSAGIRALIVSQHEAAAMGIDLALSSTSPSVRRVLEVTGLEPILTPDRAR